MAAGYLRYPDIRGDLLTFVAGDDVWLAPASGGRAWRLSADDVPVSYPRFSRDGSQVAWTSRRDGNPEVYAADAGGSTANRLTYYGVDPDVEVLITPDDAAAGRDTQLAVQLALEALDKRPLPALPRVAAGPGKARRPLPPRPGSLAASDAGAR